MAASVIPKARAIARTESSVLKYRFEMPFQSTLRALLCGLGMTE
jgi:hypothetical protein